MSRILSSWYLRSSSFLVFLLCFGLVACGQDQSTGLVEPTGIQAEGSLPSDNQSDPDATWVIQISPGSSANEIAKRTGATVLDEYHNLALLSGNVDRAALAKDAGVMRLDLNKTTQVVESNDVIFTFFEGGWDTENPSQQGLTGLDLDQAHTVSTGAGVRVAILDTGVSATHPALADVVEINWTPTGHDDLANQYDDDQDGLIDEAWGHGTHIAGLVAMVAPEVTILPMRVLDSDGVGTVYELASGLMWALFNGADIVNLSLSMSGESALLESVLDFVTSSGLKVVAAAGNQSGTLAYPASSQHTVAVAAADDGGVLAWFSGFGGADVAAPGVGLVSAFPGNDSAIGSGTSMACAVATGTLALQGEDLDQGLDALYATAASIHTGVTFGLVDPVAALAYQP